jgi:hypothetical protein
VTNLIILFRKMGGKSIKITLVLVFKKKNSKENLPTKNIELSW